ncbi:transposase DNA-binding-containing protein [Escherichia coli]|uniref:transposase DNA-binding-containing protein n=1 Tax=Escherichia coli TaxID=562 RepID=UPI003C30C8AB
MLLSISTQPSFAINPRRTRRLVSLTSSLAQHAGLSIVKSSHFTAQVEGAYRLIRNPSVSP